MTESTVAENTLVIGEGVSFTGTIEAPGAASIHGTVNGKIKSLDLQIGPKGHVVGEIEATTIDVYGTIAEKIMCHEHLVIHRSGMVSGHLNYTHIEIERGGKFVGSMNQQTSASNTDEKKL